MINLALQTIGVLSQMTKESALKILNVLQSLSDLTGGSEVKELARCVENDLIPWFDHGDIRPGDVVVLTKTPEINQNNSWGWMGSKHFLTEGKTSTVKHVEMRNGRPLYLIKPHEQTWVSSLDGREHPCDVPCFYYFGESWVRFVERPESNDE